MGGEEPRAPVACTWWRSCGIREKAARALGLELGEAIQNGSIDQKRIDMAAWLVSQGDCDPVYDGLEGLWTRTIQAPLVIFEAKAYDAKLQFPWDGGCPIGIFWGGAVALWFFLYESGGCPMGFFGEVGLPNGFFRSDGGVPNWSFLPGRG